MTLGPDGSDIVFIGGQPETMDKGLTNAVLIGLFTKRNWVGSKLIGCEGLAGSDFLTACNSSLTLSNINNIRIAAETALATIGECTVEVSNPRGSILTISITIRPPSGNIEEFILSKDGLHWYFQSLKAA